jgi:hypothetical protein
MASRMMRDGMMQWQQAQQAQQQQRPVMWRWYWRRVPRQSQTQPRSAGTP